MLLPVACTAIAKIIMHETTTLKIYLVQHFTRFAKSGDHINAKIFPIPLVGTL